MNEVLAVVSEKESGAVVAAVVGELILFVYPIFTCLPLFSFTSCNQIPTNPLLVLKEIETHPNLNIQCYIFVSNFLNYNV